MNKHQKALDTLVSFAEQNPDIVWELKMEKEVIQELVDRETPMKPEIPNNSSLSFCGRCKTSITHYVGSLAKENFKYCKSCGQRIDWIDDEA